MAAIHVDLSGIVATGETGLGGCGDVSYPDLDNLVIDGSYCRVVVVVVAVVVAVVVVVGQHTVIQCYSYTGLGQE